MTVRRSRASRWFAAAAMWTGAYGALGLYWSRGGSGFPYAEINAARAAGAALLGLPPEVTGLIIALLAAAVSTFAMVHLSRRFTTTAWAVRLAWTMVIVLLLTVPDARLLIALVNVLMTRVDNISPAVVNQVWVLLGVFLWWRAARASRPQSTSISPRTGARLSHHERAVWLAAVILPLFYALRQLAWALGIHVGVTEEFIRPYTVPGARITEAILGAMAVGGALLTLGLGQRWGSRIPRRSPILPDRPVPKLLVVIPAGVVSITLAAAGLSIYRGLLAMALGLTPFEPSAALENWAVWLPTLTWLPWGLALVAATFHYHRRRSLERQGLPHPGRLSSST